MCKGDNMDVIKQLIKLGQYSKQLNDIYHDYAKSCGLSDTSLWILCYIHEKELLNKENGNSESYGVTQSELCTEWFFPPQTVNSSLKTMACHGILTLCELQNNKRTKKIVMTDRGRMLLNQFISPLYEAERNAFLQLECHEREVLVTATNSHIGFLRNEISKIKP